MNVRPIRHEDYALLIEQDRRLYPTSSPIPVEVFERTYARNQEFGMIFEENGRIVANSIFIPLCKSGWEKLIQGNLKESGYTDENIFDISRDDEIGLHNYHIETIVKTSGLSGFGLRTLGNIMKNLRKKKPQLRLVGISGLCVTVEGAKLAGGLGFEERDYKCQDHIMTRDGKLAVVQADQIQAKTQEGYKLENRCEMRVLYPGDKSIIWRYVK